MLALILGYGLVFLSAYLQLYYWCGWTEMKGKQKITSICKVIIFRTVGIVSCIIALIIAEHRTMFLFATCLFAFVFLLYDVWRLKGQIDEIVK